MARRATRHNRRNPGRALLHVAGPETRIAHIETRFARPLFLDRILETRVWRLDDHQWCFDAVDGDTTILANGRAVVEPV